MGERASGEYISANMSHCRVWIWTVFQIPAQNSPIESIVGGEGGGVLPGGGGGETGSALGHPASGPHLTTTHTASPANFSSHRGLVTCQGKQRVRQAGRRAVWFVRWLR